MNNKFILRCVILMVCLSQGSSVFASSSVAPQNRENTVTRTPAKIIRVPYINQNEIVYGCEAVSSTMLLNTMDIKSQKKISQITI